jgi:hypothetical protein
MRWKQNSKNNTSFLTFWTLTDSRSLMANVASACMISNIFHKTVLVLVTCKGYE